MVKVKSKIAAALFSLCLFGTLNASRFALAENYSVRAPEDWGSANPNYQYIYAEPVASAPMLKMGLSNRSTLVAAPPEHIPARLDFEDLGELDALVDQYFSYGVSFQDLGTDGLQSFVSTMIAPFGNVNYTIAPPFGLTEILVGPAQPSFSLNTRYINFTQPQSLVAFWVFHSLVNIPPEYRATIRAYDGPDGTGSELITPIVLPPVINGVVIIDTDQFNIRSVTIQCKGNKAAFDELAFDNATAPKGGYLDISHGPKSALALEPLVFLDGNPAYLGEFYNYGPVTLSSLAPGDHTVTLYLPGYEWYQKIISVPEMQLEEFPVAFEGMLFPVEEPRFNYSPTVYLKRAPSTTIDVGSNANPYLIEWNNDRRLDLLVGNSNGDVYVYLGDNSKSAESVEYFASSPVPVMSGYGTHAAPIAGDYYTDGKIDLLVGYGDGSVNLHYNTGTDDVPAFDASPYDQIPLVTVEGGYAKPFLADWDNNGKKDLLVGSFNGNVYLFLNQRTNASPLYPASPDAIVAHVPSYASPSVVQDYNGDGMKDLLVGAGNGRVYVFVNTGTDASPAFPVSGTPLMMKNGKNNYYLTAGANASPLMTYFSYGDLRKDLLVGNALGQIRYFKGFPANNHAPEFMFAPDDTLVLDEFATEVALDVYALDPDGDAINYSADGLPEDAIEEIIVFSDGKLPEPASGTPPASDRGKRWRWYVPPGPVDIHVDITAEYEIFDAVLSTTVTHSTETSVDVNRPY